MNVNLKNPVLIAAVIVLAAVVVIAMGPSLIAVARPANAAGCGGMGSGDASTGSGDACSAMKMGGMKMGGMHGPSDCAMLSGKITRVNKRDGSLSVQLNPGAKAGETVKKAIGQAKVGDKIAVVVMVTKDGKLASQSPHAAEMSAYVCPMHSNETSDGPAKCSACGMNMVLREDAS